MHNIQAVLKLHRVFAGLLIIAFIAACSPATTPAPVYEFATVVETVEVTREVTSEVTRLVEIPVTVTPSPTLTLTPTPDWTATPSLTSTRTRIPSATPTFTPPLVSILEHSACFYGPGRVYLYKYGLAATVWERVIGRNSEGTWIFVRANGEADSTGCWIETAKVKFLKGAVSDVPVYWMGLPMSHLYQPPKAVSASRVGNEVSIFWQAVWMTEDDYRGYLIEAWVCQGGKQVHVPIGYPGSLMPPVRENIGTFVVKVTDEPGCDIPSRAFVYSVEKHGYTWGYPVPWPPYE